MTGIGRGGLTFHVQTVPCHDLSDPANAATFVDHAVVVLSANGWLIRPGR
jgi:hypothetical protein